MTFLGENIVHGPGWAFISGIYACSADLEIERLEQGRDIGGISYLVIAVAVFSDLLKD
jgi:hypothetical protein